MKRTCKAAIPRSNRTPRAFLIACLASSVLFTLQSLAYSRTITFDGPGAVLNGTVVVGLNEQGEVVGHYEDARFHERGFVRQPGGQILPLDIAGMTFNFVSGINDQGDIIGVYEDKKSRDHSYLRTANGVYRPIENQLDPLLSALNIHDDIIGVYVGDPWTTQYSFAWFPDGSYRTLDIGNQHFTIATAINENGIVVGHFNDSGSSHAFIWTQGGGFLPFDAPGARDGTFPSAIDSTGNIVGAYYDQHDVYHGFLRTADGRYQAIDAPNAGSGATNRGTFPVGLNRGEVVGWFRDSNDVSHAFVFKGRGKFVEFDAQGAGTGSYQGTTPVGVNDAGVIAGNFIDQNHVSHGFIRTP